jgi:photosystem II stability/assembly factor-like uncharacterized protein
MSPNVGEWVSIGPTLINYGLGSTGRVTTIAIDPSDPATIYAGALSGNGARIGGCGVWKTMDGGASWLPVADSLPSLKVGALAIEPGRPTRVFAATWNLRQDSGALYRSDDAGVSWNLLVNSPALLTQRLLIDPATPSRMFAATDEGIHRSTNGGATWATVLAIPDALATDLAMAPGEPTRLLAAFWHDTDDAKAGIYETRDSGGTWRKLIGCPVGLLPTQAAGKVIRIAMARGRSYASFKNASEFALYATTSDCEIDFHREHAWERRYVAGADIARTFWSYLYVHPTKADIVYATGTNFRRSIDGGWTFELSNGPHVDHHAFAVDPSDPRFIYTGSDGGIYQSDDYGATDSWRFVGEGMANTEFYDLGHAPTDPTVVIGGTQDNGTLKRQDPGTVWDHIRGGDGATVDIDPTDATILYSMNQGVESIARQDNGGSWQGLDQGVPMTNPCANLYFQVHPKDPATMLASCLSLWATPTAPPGNWQSIFPPAGFQEIAGNVVRSAVDPSSDLYYAATNKGELYAGVGGAAWQPVFKSATSFGSELGIVDIEIDPDEPSVVYLGTSSDDAARVILLRRRAPGLLASATDITGNLPAGIQLTALALDRVRGRMIYAGTKDRGVFRGRYSATSGTWAWAPFSTGMPLAAGIEALVVHHDTGIVRVGTCGRGAYEVVTEEPIGSLLSVEGVPEYLRVHDTGGFGPPGDRIEGEVIVRLDTEPLMAFGFELRPDAGEDAHVGMLRQLRSAMAARARVRIDYERTGLRNGIALRVMQLEGKGKRRKGSGTFGPTDITPIL